MLLSERSPAGWVKVNLLMALLYFSAGLFAQQFAISYKTIVIAVFFPEGISLAFALLYGARVAYGVFAGQLLLALFNDVYPPAAIMLAIGNSVEVVALYHLFRYFNAFRGLPTFRDYAIFVLLVSLVGQIISTGFGIGAFLLFTDMHIDDALIMGKYWYMGNVTAQMLITPTILIWRLVFLDKLTLRKIPEFTLFLMVLIILLPQVYGVFDTGMQVSGIHIFSLVYPLLIFVAFRYELPGVTFVNMAIVIFSQLATVLHKGPFSDTTIEDSLLQLNLFHIFTIATSTLLALLFYEKRILQNNVIKLAYTDPLTGLLNRRRFMELARLYFKQQQRSKVTGALIMLDIDYFKKINDNYGHDVGDEVLKNLASILDSSLRDVDLKARYGGEEFVLLLAPPCKIDVVAERILKRVRATTFYDHKNQPHNITVSIGIYQIQADDDCIETIIRNADIALYQAKSRGRDRIEYYVKRPLNKTLQAN